MKTIGVFIRQSKVYVPVVARLETGLYQQIAPVYTSDLIVHELTKALDQVIAAGHPRLPHPSEEELKHYRNPLLKADGVRSLKVLIRMRCVLYHRMGRRRHHPLLVGAR